MRELRINVVGYLSVLVEEMPFMPAGAPRLFYHISGKKSMLDTKNLYKERKNFKFQENVAVHP